MVSSSYRYLGIDPGQSGGIAWRRNSYGPNEAGATPMPKTEREILEVVGDYAISTRFCIIEKVHAMPQQGVSSTFKFGVGYGGLRMALIATGVPFDEVTPQAWQKGLGIPKKKKTESKTQWKNRLKAKAQQLFPSLDVTLATADALLIAEFCRRRELGLL